MKYDRKSFLAGMEFASNLVENKLADIMDAHPDFSSTVGLISKILELELNTTNADSFMWGGKKVIFNE